MSFSSSGYKQHDQVDNKNSHHSASTMTYHQTMTSWKLTVLSFFALSSAVVMIALAIWSKHNTKGPSFSYFQHEDDHDWDSIDIQLQGQSLCELASSLPELTLLDQGAWSDSSSCPNEEIQTSSTTSSEVVWCSSPWKGITCDDDNRVISVNITGLNSVYTGSRTSTTSSSTIPSSFGIALAGSLTYLELSTNSLHGTIPTQLGYLKKLAYLGLSYNSLTNSIPSGLFSRMSALTTLSLQHNSLVGSLPSNLYDLSNLQDLRLASNLLTGTLSKSFEHLQSLKTIYLFSNKFSGTIPTQLVKLSSSLVALGLGKNLLTGTISHKLSSLTNLRIFRVQYNSLTGTVPQQLSTISSLHGMKLNCNHFTKDPFSEGDGAFDNVFYDDRSQDDTVTEHPEPGAKGWLQNCERRQRRGLGKGQEQGLGLSKTSGDDEEEEEEEMKVEE